MKRALGRSSSAVDRYVSLPYHISLVQDGEDGGKWVAAVEELPACSSRGTTPEEALAGIKNAMAGLGPRRATAVAFSCACRAHCTRSSRGSPNAKA